MENQEIYGLSKKYDIELPVFEHMVITLRPFQWRMLEKRLEAKGYRLRGPRHSGSDKYIETDASGAYYYVYERYSVKAKPVNYKDIVGSQVTTVDFVKGFLVGFLFCLFLMWVF